MITNMTTRRNKDCNLLDRINGEENYCGSGNNLGNCEWALFVDACLLHPLAVTCVCVEGVCVC